MMSLYQLLPSTTGRYSAYAEMLESVVYIIVLETGPFLSQLPQCCWSIVEQQPYGLAKSKP